MKKRISIMLVVVMLLTTCFALPVSAATAASGDCGTGVTWNLDTNGTLTISGSGAIADYSWSGGPWANYNASIKSVVIQNGVTRIGNYAFAECSNMTSISIPGSVSSIGVSAFKNSGLTSITVPSGVTAIGDYAFADCSKLTSVTIQGNVTSIGEAVFSKCSSLSNVTLPSALTTIGKEAFAYCSSLKTISIPSGVTSIGKGAFRESGLTSFDIPNGVTTIAEDTFYKCIALSTVKIPASVTAIKGYAFASCGNLGTVALPENLTSIGDYAFWGCAGMYSITIPDKVTSIGESAFCGSGLTSIVIPASVTSIGNWAFERCQYLTQVKFVGNAPTITMRGETVTEGGAVFNQDNVTVSVSTGSSWNDEAKSNYVGNGNVIWSSFSHTYDNNIDGTCNVCGADRARVEYRIVVHMHRMYNPYSGEHFYTGSDEERDTLVNAGWKYEGVGFSFPANTGMPVYRLYHEPTGEHLYTMDVEERNRLLAEGWNDERVAFNSAYDTEAFQHRLNNPYASVGAYHFTFSQDEKQVLINAGWVYQGLGWYSCFY